jgi:hypothetical protein
MIRWRSGMRCTGCFIRRSKVDESTRRGKCLDQVICRYAPKSGRSSELDTTTAFDPFCTLRNRRQAHAGPIGTHSIEQILAIELVHKLFGCDPHFCASPPITEPPVGVSHFVRCKTHRELTILLLATASKSRGRVKITVSRRSRVVDAKHAHALRGYFHGFKQAGINVPHVADTRIGGISAHPLRRVRPQDHPWFVSQKNSRGASCCSGSDAHFLNDDDWRISGKRYQVRISGHWLDVED